MKKISIVSFFYLIMLSMPAFTMGFGMYGTSGYGKVDMLKLVNFASDYRVDYSTENFLYGGGLLLESGNESEGYHNRFKMGLEGSTTFAGRNSYRRLIRAKIENVFAFRVAGTDRFRFWIGPLLGVNLLTGLINTTRSDQWSSERKNSTLALAQSAAAFGLYYIYFDRIWKRTAGVFIPVGIATGINIKLGESAALTLEGGFRFGFYYLRNGGINYEGYVNAGFIFGVI
jgi:hypothetical protein